MIIQLICLWIFFLWLILVVREKNFNHVLTYITWGIYFPLFLYTLNWSNLINHEESRIFNYIFTCSAFIITVYSFATYKIKPSRLSVGDTITMTSLGKLLAPIINWVFVVLYFTENYIGSGTIIPGLVGIDIHTYSAPIISYITNANFIFIAFDYYCWKSTKKVRYLLWIIILLLIPILTRSSRMMSVLTLVQILSLLLCIESKKLITRQEKRKFHKKILLLIVLMFITAIGLMLFTNYRMSDYGKYDITYDKQTGYIGPDWLRWASSYYGYFPLSFNNLKINILYRDIEHNYFGLYSFTSFYFGLLQLDNLLGLSTVGCFEGQLITNGSATVSTGFWEYYYDYGVLFWIPIVVALIITFIFLKKSSKATNKLTYHTLYSWYAPLWFFTSFQNVLFMSTSIITGILLYYIIEKSFTVKSGCLYDNIGKGEFK